MELNNNLPGKIFDIQGFSVHDGPGARSLIFLKGCTLQCFWCSNPEGISHSDIPLYYSSKCIGCSNCVNACFKNAVHLAEGLVSIDRIICETCSDPACIEDCYSEALRINGRKISDVELFSIIKRDSQYWGQNGGVTFSGGEPLLQADFMVSILEKCHNAYIHTAIETCGNLPWINFQKTIGYIDWIFFDLKHIDPVRHKTGTGQDNINIINNVRKLDENFKGRLVFRFPLIPGYNDGTDVIEGIASLISGTKWKEINLLPLHHLGKDKYRLLGVEYNGAGFTPPSSKELDDVKAVFEKAGLVCYIGSATPF